MAVDGVDTRALAAARADRAPRRSRRLRGSQGVLCLGGQIGRYTGPGQNQNTGNTGGFSLLLNQNQIPTPTGFVPAVAGQSRNFQAWHRDAVGGVATSNSRNGLTATFL